ncbi:MAG: DEAD/DEAH box helicase [Azospirillaceae bacterium]
MTVPSFADLGLAEPLCRALTALSYETPTPIQAQSVPALLEGRDMLGIAQTGTGKTGAFALPLLQHLAAEPGRAGPKGCRALILAPTRELAVQIADSLTDYGRHLRLRHAVILGGVSQDRQVRAVARGVDIVVATPGRLLDLVGQGHIRLDSATRLILDEADRMLDMGFIKDVRRIIDRMTARRQSLLFSATMPEAVAHLAAEILSEPVRVEVTPKTVAVDRIDQRVFHVPQTNKRALLNRLLDDRSLSRVIVFTRTKHRANAVAEQLAKTGVAAEAIHGNKSQNARQKALDRFRQGRARVLVATDIAARGIDVDGVSHVINFELPVEAESYVHRIGRTARAGADGIALSFCDPAERPQLRGIEKLIRRRLDEADSVDGLTIAAPANTDQASAGAKRGGGSGDASRRNNRPKRNRGPRRRAA